MFDGPTNGRDIPSGFWAVYADHAFALGMGVGLTDIPPEQGGGGGGGGSGSFSDDAFDTDAFDTDAFDIVP